MLAEPRLGAPAPDTLRTSDENWDLASGLALGVSTGVGFAASLLAIGYYLDLDGTRSMLHFILRGTM